MMIRPATALRNNYDSMVKLSTEKQEPIYLTRNGEGEMVFLPIGKRDRRSWNCLRKCCAGNRTNWQAPRHILLLKCRRRRRTCSVKVEWLTEARAEYRQFLQYYKTEVGLPYAKKFADTILGSINQLAEFPEMGAVKYDTLMGKHDFRALFIENYVCVYRIESDTVYVYHLADARKNYIYHIFGME